MKVLWFLLLLTPFVHADEDFDDFDPDASQINIIEPFIIEARDMPLPCKPGVRITGDVRSGYQHQVELINNFPQIGKGSGTPDNPAGLGKDRYAVAFNLYFDYRDPCGDKWASVKLGYKNAMGVESGTAGGLSLSRANVGLNLYCGWRGCWFVELGRKPLSDIFTSEILFGARMDGFVTRFQTEALPLGDFFVQAAAFVYDFRINHYGWAAAIGLSDILCSPFYVQYAYIDWQNQGQGPGLQERLAGKNSVELPQLPGVRNNPRFYYADHQILVGYRVPRFFMCNHLNIFAAYIYNSAAVRSVITDGHRFPEAWYLGFELGRVRCCGDWAVKLQYQFVEPQSVFEQDIAGIGIGNNQSNELYRQLNLLRGGTIPLSAVSAGAARGNTNYKGWKFEGAYGLLEDFTVKLAYARTNQATRVVGGRHLYRVFSIEGVYTF